MPSQLLFFTLYLVGILNNQPTFMQTPDGVQVSGVCYDFATAVYLPVEAFAMSGSTKINLGQSDKDGKFSFLLPLSATSISFTSTDYQTVTLPVTFVNHPGSGAAFRFGIIMGKRDSMAVRQTNQLLLSNDLSDSTAIDYTIEPTGSNAGLPLVTTAHGNRVAPGGHFAMVKGKKIPAINFEGARPGPYRAIVSMANGQILVDKVFTVKEGLTFMEVRADEPTVSGSDKGSSPDNKLLPALKTVYFEQSRFELNPATKASLDSIARMLITQQGTVAHITGYTDNVGELKLNETLSEYRAKVVASYLRNKGVQETQLRTDWKGGNSLTDPGESENAKAKNRRVVIQFDRR